MGKKARKTRWRTLSIGEVPSDTESQTGDGARPPGPRGRWSHTGSGPGSHQRYTSSHSTPTRHHNHYHHSGDGSTKWGPAGAAASTRSSSIASDTKITFNEDEYTKITTPRQDVLFKKGYLSRPKPHLQRPLTSAGNSTGDGTPDHHSADGADYPESEVDMFPYPSALDPALFYLNTGAGAQHPVLLYDQFGNTALCYPPTLPPPPSLVASRAPPDKRYSLDSMTGSSSPTHDEADDEKMLRKKRRRRKHDDDDDEDEDEEEEEEEEDDDDDEEEEEAEESTKGRIRVDAEEFIPRGFTAPPPALSFVPLVPHEVFPGAFVFVGPPVPPPHFYSSTAPLDYTPDTDTATTQHDQEMEATHEVPVEGEASKGGPPAIDIAKIVSKLEQAALEQKLMEQEQELEQEKVEEKGKEIKMVESPQKLDNVEESKPEPAETNKTEAARPAAARYADRLKTQQQQQQQQNPRQPAAVAATVQHKPHQRTTRPQPPPPKVCPRLERAAKPPSAPALAPAAPDQWISVSGKKKRKQQKEVEVVKVVEVVPVEAAPLDTIVTISEPPPAPPSASPVVTPPQQPASAEKVVKKSSTRKKQIKKRIIITDGALPGPTVETPPSVVSSSLVSNPSILTTPELEVLDDEAATKNKVDSAESDVPEKEIPEAPAPLPTIEHKKTKKRNKKSKGAVGDPDTGTGEVASGTDDVSLELERMIQRGLYATLEQRLLTHNPGDSFLATFQHNARSAASPSTAPSPPPVTPPPPPPPPPPLSITRAVREWMDRTRETTPDLEIFRRPQDLRHDVLSRVLHLDAAGEGDDLDEEEPQGEQNAQEEEEDDVVVEDLEHDGAVDVARDVLDNHRSRSASVDLLQCWGPPEEAEDALAACERIESAAGLRLRPRARGDGGLPYRAICCTVM